MIRRGARLDEDSGTGNISAVCFYDSIAEGIFYHSQSYEIRLILSSGRHCDNATCPLRVHLLLPSIPSERTLMTFLGKLLVI